MASGSYAKKSVPQEPMEIQSRIPPRATRQLPEETVEELETEAGLVPARTTTGNIQQYVRASESIKAAASYKPNKIISEFRLHPLERHKMWLSPLVICLVIGVIFSVVLLSSAIFQRPGAPQLVSWFGGKVYSVQVGGDLNTASSWETDQPMTPKVSIPAHMGPYAVMGKPTLTVDFMNKVLTGYNSPAAGKAQALYDLGVKYNIDPAFALAFFLHESTFGTAGEARKTLSLGNLRCIPNADCVDQDRGGYASFPSWESGFEAWYKLIRNLYVAQWGLITVDQIIPKYAPNSDNNNEQGYINSLKHCLDTWHAGVLRP
jgi:hypothetical protein